MDGLSAPTQIVKATLMQIKACTTKNSCAFLVEGGYTRNALAPLVILTPTSSTSTASNAKIIFCWKYDRMISMFIRNKSF